MALPSNFLGDLIASTQGGTVEPQPNIFNRLVAGLGNDPTQIADPGPLSVRGMTAAEAGAAPRVRRSVLDMLGDTFGSSRNENSLLSKIGGIADVIATVGGATPLFQQGVDSRLARDQAKEDRQFDMGNRPLERQLLEQRVASGQQGLDAGSLELQGARNNLLDSAGAGLRQVFATTGAAGLAKAWPLVAQQLGIPDEQAAQIGEALGADAEGTLAALFPNPVAQQGSTAKEAQIFALLKAQGTPEMAQAYLTSISNPDAVTPYQQAQLDLARQKFGFDQYKFANPNPTAGERTAATKATEAEEARAASAQTVTTTLDELSGIYDQLNEMGAMVNPKQGTAANIAARARASGLGQMVEGAVGTQAQELRDRVESIRPGLMQQLAKATGMTGKQLDSNADVKLFMQTVTDPTRSYEANQRAIAGLRRLLANPPRQSAPRAAPAPRQKGAPRQQRPAVPQKGTVRQGYRFNGGDPADKRNWVKVQ